MPVTLDKIDDFYYDVENTPWNFKPLKKEYNKMVKLQNLLADYLAFFEDKTVDEKWERNA